MQSYQLRSSCQSYRNMDLQRPELTTALQYASELQAACLHQRPQLVPRLQELPLWIALENVALPYTYDYGPAFIPRSCFPPTMLVLQ